MTVLVPLSPTSNLVLEEGGIESFDLSDFDLDDFVSISLPAFPKNNLNLTNSTVGFTSHPEGNFGSGPSALIAFSNSTTPLVNGDSEFRFPLANLVNLDLTNITGVRFSMVATGSCTFRCLSVRVLSKHWITTPTDINTRDHRLVRSVAVNGVATPGYNFPASTFAFPITWRSSEPPSEATDPQPVDASLEAEFNTGSADGFNAISFFFRGKSIDYNTMLDLDGTPVSELSGQPQPDFGEAKFAPRTQINFDGIKDSVPGPGVDSGSSITPSLTQSQLDGTHQFDLERTNDSNSAAYIQVRILWDSSVGAVEFWDSESPTPYYTFTLDVAGGAADDTLVPNTQYIAILNLKDQTMRARIFEQAGNQLGTLVFDSTPVTDPAVFKRRRGRLGWHASFSDGDAYVTSIRPRGLSFGEYRSHLYQSQTPVAGAQLQVGGTGVTDLFKGIDQGPWGGQFTDLPDRGPEAFKIRNTAVAPLQGVQTNSIYFDDFENTSLEFDILVSKEALDVGAVLYFLWDGVSPVSLPLGNLIGNTWNHISLPLKDLKTTIRSGFYTIAFVQSIVGLPNDWALDNIQVIRKSLNWEARSTVPDPWNLHEADWMNFQHTLNQSNGGVLFRERHKGLQIRGTSLRQDTRIGQIRVTPKYAELGRVVWADQAFVPSASSDPISSFTFSTSGLTVSTTSTASDVNGWVASNAWTFGDGASDFGTRSSHTYAHAGTYPVTLTVTDNNGERRSTTQNVTVT